MNLNDAFIRDPRSKGLNPTTKLAGHIMTAVLDYAKEKDLSTMTLDDVYDFVYKMQEHSL